jgi:hypothetical protein
MLLRIIFLSVLVSSTASSVNAAPDVSTNCTTASGSFTTEDKKTGKTYQCTSKKTCTTTTCKLGVGYNCSVSTTTSHSNCAEAAPTPSSSAGQFTPIKPKGDVFLAPTKDKYNRFPSKVTRDTKGTLAPSLKDRQQKKPKAFAGRCDRLKLGQAAFFQHGKYKGTCVVRNMGHYASAKAIGIGNDKISSIKIGRGTQVRLCKDKNYKGGCTTYTKSMASLGKMNDKTSSAIIVRSVP